MLRIISIIVLLLFSFSTTAAPVLAAINYQHDANGNMTSNGTRCYEYNEANQLKKIKRCSDNQIIAEYVYDYTGKRLIKKEYENGVLKQTVLSPSDEYETKKLPDGTTKNTTYYKVNDELVAKKNPDGSMNYYHNDHLGSNSVLTDQNGNVVEKTTYEPYGEVKSGGTKSKFGYTGQEKDLETGLNYYDARYYDSHIQRFIQPDTMLPDVYDPQQLNRYSYARNNPLKYTDPSGHFIVPLILVAVRVATAIAPVLYKAVTSPAVKSAATAIVNNAKSFTSSAVNVGKSVASNLANTVQTFASTNNAAKASVSNANSSTQRIPDSMQKIAPAIQAVTNNSDKVHGNDLKTNAQTWGYTLRNATGDIFKYGQSINPEGRYSKTWLDANGLRMFRETSGNKLEMRTWEHESIGDYIFKYGEAPILNNIERSVNVFR